ncbi:MAG: MotA/TolQ/ExbB proton channel family protein [Pirellulales bacterium]|nr:MotA/TolQ/ExbB proton channel family protein [Pirellulales bacterium]
MNKTNDLAQALFRSPILWGGLASAGFFALIHTGVPGSDLLMRYCAGHPVEYIETVMFFVGLAALLIKAIDVSAQSRALADPLLGPVPRGGQPVAAAEELIVRLRRLPPRRQKEYLVHRMYKGLEYVCRRNSPEALDEELRYLADLDADRAHAGYGLVRAAIWAIPILGFLGTVIGITMAVASLSPQNLESSMPTVVAALGVAFDTTAQALALSMILFFTQFFVDRAESNLLGAVGDRVEDELLGRFETVTAGPDGQLVAIRKMGEALVAATEQLVQRQAELWQASIEATQQRAVRSMDAAGQQLQKSVAAALADSLKAHAQSLVEAEQSAVEKNRRQWEQIREALGRYGETLAAMQNSLVEKAEVLGRAADATGQVAKMEDTLNRNLAALAGAKNFEQTVMSLAAAIHLLNARLGDAPAAAPTVHLGPSRRSSQAA